MKRREFIGVLASTAASPLLAHAQALNTPTVGMISPTERSLAGYRRGLAELGYVDGQNVRLDIKMAHLQYERYADLFQGFVDRGVDVIISGSTVGLVAAKSVVQTTPIVFNIGSDPIENGFVESLNKPGGNITGIFTLNVALAGKRLELLHELVPSVTRFAFLTNPASPKFNEPETREVRAAAQRLGLDILVVDARRPEEFEAAFEAAVGDGAGGLVVGSEGMLISYPSELVALAARYHLPAVYGDDQPPREGGLISYGADNDDSYRVVGTYAARVLKGERPRDMPVQQSTRTRLVINLKIAQAMGIAVPTALLVGADEVIE